VLQGNVALSGAGGFISLGGADLTGNIAVTGPGLASGLVTSATTATIAGSSRGVRIFSGGTVIDAGTISAGGDAVHFYRQPQRVQRRIRPMSQHRLWLVSSAVRVHYGNSAKRRVRQRTKS
jgi:hypothetical protein